MRLSGSRAYYRPSPPKMPPGLVELMEGLTREVLKSNPSDVYGFCASHMHQLLEKRDGPSLKKSLPLEDKIARVQEKVRLRAETRRQEYDKKIIQLQQNGNATNNEVKDGAVQVPHLVASVPNSLSTVLNKDTITSSVNDVAQNIKTPVRQEQVLENSAEMEIAQSGLVVSKPEDKVTESKDDEEGSMKTNFSLSEEKCVSVAVTEPDSEPIGNIIEEDISSNTELHTENFNKELINDTSKSPDVVGQLNENQQDEKIINEVQVEVIDSGDTIVNDDEKVKNNNEVAADNGIVNISINIENNLSITPNDDLKNSGDTIVNDDEKVKNNNEVAADNGIVNTSIDIENNLSVTPNDDLKKSNNIENTTIEDVQAFSKVGDIYDLDQTTNNVEQFQHTEKLRVSTPIEDVQQSNDVTNVQTASDIPKTDNNGDVQNLIDTPGIPQAENTDTNDFLPENSSKILQEFGSEKDTQSKSDDELPPLNSPTKSDIGNKQEYIEHTQSKLHDIKEIKMPVLETGAYIDFPAGVDSDIPTMVTENAGNDTNEIKVSENDTLQAVTPLDNMSEVYKENVDLDKLISDKNICDPIKDADGNTLDVSTFTMQSNNDDTTQGEISSNMSDKATENPGTNNMDLETAAVTIQKVFRKFLFKSRGSTFEDTTNDEGNFLDEDDNNKAECDFSIANALNIDRRPHGITRMDTVLQTVNEEKSLSLSTDDSSTLSSAATIIQAHVRGFLVRNKLNSNKTVSTNSLAASNSNEPSITSIEANNGSNQNKNKTVLNIHIVPEGENYLSRDESLITSMELSLDSSPPSSINLHPLGYDKSERRKQLKREDAIQSISPPSNNSGKLSEDFDSVKELPLNDHHDVAEHILGDIVTANGNLAVENGHIQTSVENGSLEIILKGNESIHNNENNTIDTQTPLKMKRQSLSKMSSDEMDVVTPYMSHEDLTSSNLMHSGEFHDAVLPTRVSRSDTSVVSEFKNVLVYFLLWNHPC